jgi:hypothetical protein
MSDFFQSHILHEYSLFLILLKKVYPAKPEQWYIKYVLSFAESSTSLMYDPLP